MVVETRRCLNVLRDDISIEIIGGDINIPKCQFEDLNF